MNIKLDIDVTPKELREFFGLPDVQPLQDEMLQDIRDKMQAGAEGFDPISLMKPFLPQNLQTVEAMQKAFWQAFSAKRDPAPKD